MATVIKLKKSTVADRVPTTSDLVDGEVAINLTDRKIYVNNGGTIVEVANATGQSGEIPGHLIPATNDTYDLGSSSKRWRTAYLAASTLDLGGATISSDGSGTISIAAAGATLPVGSLIGSEKIAGANTDGVLLRTDIPFFKTGDLDDSNATFTMKSSGEGERIFNNFTLASGQAITTQETTLFSF